MSLKILLAEDDSTTRRLLTRALALQGHEVVAVENGHELVARFAEIEPDLVLTDWHMPEMDGVEAIRRVRYGSRAGRDVFIVLTTGVHGEEATAEAIEAGADDYLLKPASPSALRVLVTLAEHRISKRRSTGHRSERRSLGASHASDMLSSFPGLLMTCDVDGKIEEVSDVAQMQWGVAAGEELCSVLGESAWDKLRLEVGALARGDTKNFRWSPRDDAAAVEAVIWSIYIDNRRVGYGIASAKLGATSESPLARAAGAN